MNNAIAIILLSIVVLAILYLLIVIIGGTWMWLRDKIGKRGGKFS